MLYREIIAVYFQIHTEHQNTLCGQNVELLDAKPGGTLRSAKIKRPEISYVPLRKWRAVQLPP
jgi:hypothetical protein